MYLKRIDGPRTVRLPDGTKMTRADLPPPETMRWVASRKMAVVRAVTSGLLTEEQAREMYGLSEEELSEWIAGAARHGMAGLKATALQKLKQP